MKATRPAVRCHIPEDWNVRGTNRLQILVKKRSWKRIRQLSSSQCRCSSCVYCHQGRLSSCYFTEVMRHELYNNNKIKLCDQILRIWYRFFRTPSDWQRKQKLEIEQVFVNLWNFHQYYVLRWFNFFLSYVLFCLGAESETQVVTLYIREMNGWHMAMPHPFLTLRWLMSYIYGAPILDVSRSHTTTQHSR